LRKGAALDKRCVQCGKPFEAKLERAKYCSGSCRALASQGVAPVATIPVQQVDAGLAESVRERVELANLTGSVDGVSAIALASRMEKAQNDNAYASLHRQLLVAMDRIDALAPKQGAMDELRLRRDRKRARPA